MRVDYGYVFRISLNHAISRQKSRFKFEIKLNPYELLVVNEILFFNQSGHGVYPDYQNTSKNPRNLFRVFLPDLVDWFFFCFIVQKKLFFFVVNYKYSVYTPFKLLWSSG